ncbi:hypothetical protein GRF29_161g1271578 [Pseudopithomyces chartarum]|uniref:Uncharacterized protein n=1 Tax=Pseudopithomyces chartarum TaxID=1892770 RepID=A0AAN6LQ62_9PLEO|nr:hypothetical protein GRF29_161g1271578 [Pseudopithomyces chartarum]
MSEHFGDCAREGGLRFNGATFMADNLFTLFTNRIADLQQSSRDIVETYHTVRASMFAPDITIPSLEAKEMELLGCVERLEAKSQEVEALLGQVDINTAAQLIRTLPMFQDDEVLLDRTAGIGNQAFDGYPDCCGSQDEELP